MTTWLFLTFRLVPTKWLNYDTLNRSMYFHCLINNQMIRCSVCRGKGWHTYTENMVIQIWTKTIIHTNALESNAYCDGPCNFFYLALRTFVCACLHVCMYRVFFVFSQQSLVRCRWNVAYAMGLFAMLRRPNLESTFVKVIKWSPKNVFSEMYDNTALILYYQMWFQPICRIIWII